MAKYMVKTMENKRNIIIDSYIPFIDGLLDPYFNVRVLTPDQIDAAAVRDADALLIRTRTRCNGDLFGDSPRCSFVGTATIGFDHIDRGWCAAHGITAVNAPGCNAPAVAQYIFAAIARLINRPVDQYTLGIVGVGHVGDIVRQWALSMGMRVLCCDPPRQRSGEPGPWYTLPQVARQADIITFHTPLTRDGEDRTFHLADAAFFDSLDRAPIVINAARGPVVDTQAMIRAIDSGAVSHAVIDTWEGEPRINSDLLARAAIATPHIAGYSRAGKIRATRMVLDALSAHFGLPRIDMPVTPAPAVPDKVMLPVVTRSYDIMADDRILRAAPQTFEALRDNYDLRGEVPARPVY